MSHVLTKVSLIAAVVLSSCGNREQKEAEAMYVLAETAAESGDYARSVQLIDSIDSLYGRQIDVRRKSMHLKAIVTEKQTLAEIETNEAEAVRLKLKGDSLQRMIEKVDNPIEPYFVAKGLKSVAGNNGIEARMSPDGMFYMISSLKSPRVNHTYVSVSDGVSAAQTAAIAYDGERNDRSLGYEIIHYMMLECDSVGHFVATHPGRLTLTYGGGSKSYTTELPAQQAAAVATLYRSAVNIRDMRRNALERQRLDKQLELARSHAARTYQDEAD